MLFNDNETELISKILGTKDRDEAYNIILNQEASKIILTVFKVDDTNNLNVVNYTETKIKNKWYWKFEGDEYIYSCNGNYYMLHKKKLLKLYNKLIELINNNVESDLIEYINNKYVEKIKSCDYHHFLGWFNMLFIFYIHSLSPDERNKYNFYTIPSNYKTFRRWVIEFNKVNSCNNLIIKNVLQILKKIELPEELEQTIKIFSNITIIHFLNGFNPKLH